jgi:hypothetical protein
MLVLGVAATLAANADFGSNHGIAGIVLSAWPAIAFVGSAEISRERLGGSKWDSVAALSGVGTQGDTATGASCDASGPDSQERGYARPVKQVSQAACTARHQVGAAENELIGAALYPPRPRRRHRFGFGIAGVFIGLILFVVSPWLALAVIVLAIVIPVIVRRRT